MRKLESFKKKFISNHVVEDEDEGLDPEEKKAKKVVKEKKKQILEFINE